MAEEKSAMVVGIDDSEQSFYALEWVLDHFFAAGAPNYPFNLVLVHAKPAPSFAIGMAGPGITFSFSLHFSLLLILFVPSSLFSCF